MSGISQQALQLPNIDEQAESVKECMMHVNNSLQARAGNALSNPHCMPTEATFEWLLLLEAWKRTYR